MNNDMQNIAALIGGAILSLPLLPFAALAAINVLNIVFAPTVLMHGEALDAAYFAHPNILFAERMDAIAIEAMAFLYGWGA